MVSDDIVTRLRESSGMTTSRSDDGFLSIHPDTDLMRQAADEIERLREQNDYPKANVEMLLAEAKAAQNV